MHAHRNPEMQQHPTVLRASLTVCCLVLAPFLPHSSADELPPLRAGKAPSEDAIEKQLIEARKDYIKTVTPLPKDLAERVKLLDKARATLADALEKGVAAYEKAGVKDVATLGP